MGEGNKSGEGSKVWQVEVIELRRVPVVYRVAAATADEAVSKAERGDTLEEEGGERYEVQERYCYEGATLVAGEGGDR